MDTMKWSFSSIFSSLFNPDLPSVASQSKQLIYRGYTFAQSPSAKPTVVVENLEKLSLIYGGFTIPTYRQPLSVRRSVGAINWRYAA